MVFWPRPRSEYAGGSDRADLSGAKAPEGPAYRYDGCLREPCVLNGAGGPPSPTAEFGGAGGAADVAPARWTAPGVNLRRVLRVGSWNVLSLSEDHQLPHLSDELSRLRVDVVGLSETRRPGSGETSSKGFTYYWSGTSNGHHVKGVAIGISPSRLQQPSVVEGAPVDEHIIRSY